MIKKSGRGVLFLKIMPGENNFGMKYFLPPILRQQKVSPLITSLLLFHIVFFYLLSSFLYTAIALNHFAQFFSLFKAIPKRKKLSLLPSGARNSDNYSSQEKKQRNYAKNEAKKIQSDNYTRKNRENLKLCILGAPISFSPILKKCGVGGILFLKSRRGNIYFIQLLTKKLKIIKKGLSKSI